MKSALRISVIISAQMVSIKEVEMVDSAQELKSSRSVSGNSWTRRLLLLRRRCSVAKVFQ